VSTRILYVHHRPEASGAAQSLALLIGALDQRFEPHVLVPGGAAAALFAAAGATVHAGPVSTFTHTWDVRYEGMRWAVLGREIARLPALARALDAVSPGLVHVNDAVAVVAGQLAHARGIPVVWHLRTSLAGGRRGRAVGRRLDRWGAAAIAIDADVARSYPISLPTTVVPNPVAWAGAPPSRATSAQRAMLGIPPGTVSIGFFGYLRRQKGWPELVHAADALARRGAAFHVVVVGGGVRPPEWYRTRRGRVAAALRVARDEETEMRELVERLGLASRFSFVPFTDDVRAVYGALDIVVFPNTGAGLGRPVLEAAAAGVPVVASGSPDGAGILLPGKTGILLDRSTSAGLATAAEDLIRDDESRTTLGDAAAVHARRRFSPASHARAVEAAYDEVTARPRRTA
jgi:glycosyltransferase involved in cell wall biosynthesis